MITKSIKQEFEFHGIIKLKNFLSHDKVAQSQNLVRQNLEREGIWKDGTWNFSEGESSIQDRGKAFLSSLKKQGQFVDLLSEAQQLISEFLDQRSTYPATDYPHPLVTLPNSTSWSIPTKSWHLDCPRLSSGEIPGIQAFTFLETVTHGGAGTLAVMGSHRLLNNQGFLRSKQVLQQLKQETYFRNLMSKYYEGRQRFMHESGYIDDVELQVIEMIGEPGDVFLMDLRILHVGAPNALSIPRIMLTQRYLLESAQEEYHGKSTS